MDEIRKNWKIIVALIGYLLGIGSWIASVNSRTFDDVQQKRHVVEHCNNKDVHMPMEEKMKIFVPRTEIEGKLEAIMRELKYIREGK